MFKIIMKVKPVQTFLQMHVDNGNTWKKHETHPKPAIKATKLPIAIYWWFLYQLQISSHIIYRYLHYWLRTRKSRLDLLDNFLCQLNSFKGIDLSQLLNDAFSFLTDKASAIWPLHVLLQYPFPIHYYKVMHIWLKEMNDCNFMILYMLL